MLTLGTNEFSHIDWYIVFFNGFLNCDVLLSLKIVFTQAKNADPDEMLHSSAYHLGPHFLPN